MAGYNRIVYPNVYPLIDLWVFSGTLGQKVMFVMWPGADPKDIELEFTGQNELLVDFDGWLRMLLAGEWISLPQPVAYQFDSLNTILPLPWTVEYEPQGNAGIVTLEYDTYDPSMPLVFLIGPPPMGGPSFDEDGLCWSTYMGGDGTDAANDVEVDNAGNIHVAGSMTSSFMTFPGFPGIEFAESGNLVAYLTRFDAAYQLVWTLFLGGDVLDPTYTTAENIAIREGSNQQLFLSGNTKSENYWTLANGVAYYDDTYAGSSIYGTGFVAEFSALGEMIWSTYFGEDGVNITGMDVVPGTNSLAIAGFANEFLPTPQLTPPTGSMDLAYAGNGDAFIALFNTAGELFMRSWWGGTLDDGALSVRAYSGKIIMAGHTSSPGITLVDPGFNAYVEPHHGNSDCFLVELSSDGVPQWSTYIGGGGQDLLGRDGLFIGPERDVFLCGNTLSADLEMVNGPNWHDDTFFTSSEFPPNGFVVRFDGSDRSRKWVTYLGHGQPMVLESIIQDSGDGHRIHLTGYTKGVDAPITTLPGQYNQSAVLESQYGSVYVTFSDEQELEHATWYGGGFTCVKTHINALAEHSSGTVAVGNHQKAGSALSYFPLDDAQGGAWFDGFYNDMALSVLGEDGFLSLFCSELSVGIPWSLSGNPSGLLGHHEPGELVLFGADLQGQGYQVHDAVGRCVQRGVLNQANERATIALPAMAAGAYLIRLQDARSAKFLVR